MASVAIVETKLSRTNYKKEFGFEFDRFALCSDSTIKTVRKKDVDIDFNPDEYEWVILVGKDAFKHYTGKTAIMDYSGKVVDGKFLASINPAMITFKPEVESLWVKTRDAIKGYVTGEIQATTADIYKFPGIQDEQEALKFIQEAINHTNRYVAIDCETTGLYPRDGYLQGVSLSYKKDWGAYISSDCLSEEVVSLLQVLLRKKIMVLHNAKFDIPFLEWHLGLKFYQYEDTMLLHYCLDENPGTHGLKQLALKMTAYGDYEQELSTFIKDYCSSHGILKGDFKWEFIPFETMVPYAATDAVVTLLIFTQLAPKVASNPKLNNVYRNILLPASTALIKIQDNGVPFDKDRIAFGQMVMSQSIGESVKELATFKEITDFEAEKGAPFNANSPKQLRELLFDKIGLTPTGKKTETRADSTDAEVLKELAEFHPVPAQILNIRKKSKIKNTYLDKIIINLNNDGRLRTNFNIHGTVAGRLSSSGKLNMQQLPRDASVVKGSIKARDGYKIVSMDLQTAEVYIAAVLSNDKELKGIFLRGEDFHSSIAKRVFKLTCPVEEVKKLHPDLRQSAKTVTFSILYQAGFMNLYDQVQKYIRDNNLDMSFSMQDAKDAIDEYFKNFPTLKRWLQKNKDDISVKGYVYSFFGRKRRLPNVKSDNRAVASHAVRSGLNFLVQSPASDVNLLAAIEMVDWLETHDIDAKIFALVHDSILAEVKEEHVDKYTEVLSKFIQKDRGLSIPGSPIGYEFEVGDDYSFGKFEKEHGEAFKSWYSGARESNTGLVSNDNDEPGQGTLAV